MDNRLLINPVAALETATIKVSLGRLLQSTGRIVEAEYSHLEARAIFEKLSAGSPATPSYRNNLALCNDLLGSLYVMAGHHKEAGEALGRARPIFEKLIEDHPGEAWNETRWADLLQHQGALAYYLGDFAKAGRLLEQALPHYQSALKAIPHSLEVREGMRSTCWLRAHLLVLQGKHAEAAQAAVDLSRLGVSSWKDRADAAGFLAECVSLAGPQQQEVAQAYRRQARQLLEEALQAGAQDAAAQEPLAWLLAMAADPQLRDPQRAIALARQAVEREPKKGGPWQKLGVACYRAGDWEGARTALEKAAALSNGRMPTVSIVLAMAYWHLGDQEKAGRLYDRAIAEVKGPVEGQLFCPFRTEAAALLGKKD
jgi:tetratricopeptide (TPR) repeat protein